MISPGSAEAPLERDEIDSLPEGWAEELQQHVNEVVTGILD